MIAGIVLAAGQSSRLGRPKQLLPVHGEPLLRYTLRRVLASRLGQFVVIVGHETEAVRAAIADLPVTIVGNPQYARGQSTSVRAGIAALPPEADAAVFLLGDQPGIDPEVVDALIVAWHETQAPVVAPRYEDGVGNPVLFDRRLFAEFEGLRGDSGAKPIVEAHRRAGNLLTVPTRGRAPRDVDTEADFAALLASLPDCPALEAPPRDSPSPIVIKER